MKEAASRGKVSTAVEQMVPAGVLHLLASDAYHSGRWRERARRGFAKLFD